MSDIKWNALPGLTVYMSTELNALGNGSNKLGAAIDFDQNTGCAIELTIAEQGSNRSAGAHVVINLIKSADGGTTYEYGSDSIDPPKSAMRLTPDFDVATAARVWVGAFYIPFDMHAKLLIQNETGQAFGATGNVLKYAKFSGEI